MIVLAMMAAVLGAPIQDGSVTVVDRGNPNAASRTMARFMDNQTRLLLLEGDQNDLQRRRAEVSRQRWSLAERLDRMIAHGNCDGARDLAKQSRHQDIGAQVERVCDARRAG